MNNVAIIILNWNGWTDTIECLESLYRIDYPHFDVIVVDNASEDESIEKIKEYAEGRIEVQSEFFEGNVKNKPIIIEEYTKKEAEDENNDKKVNNLPSNKKLILIRNEKNYGFAEGNNIGIKYSLKALKSDFILLLNNDTVVKKDFLSELMRVVNFRDDIGIVGCKICYYDDPDKIWSSDCKIGYWTGALPVIGSEEAKETDWVSGCGFLINTELIKYISLLDPKLFFGWEDVDYCIRAKKAGYKIIYDPNSIIWHKVSSSRKKLQRNAFSPYYNRLKSRYLFLNVLKKYSSKYQQISQILFFLILFVPLIGIILPIYSLTIEKPYFYLNNLKNN